MNLTPWKISKIMKHKSPVFIVGAPRSGSSILYRTLQRHSSFQPQECQSEVNLVESCVFQSQYMSYDACSNNNKAFKYMLGNEKLYYHFLESTHWIQMYQNILIKNNVIHKSLMKLKRTFGLQATVQKVSLNNISIRAFFYFAQQARGMNRIIEKSPLNIFKLPEIKATFPNSKLLFIYRHPIDVFSSYRRRYQVSVDELGIAPSKLGWLKLSLEKFCDDYSKYMNLALTENISNPHQLMMLKYESFINNPQLITSSICDFLEEPYEEMLPAKEGKNWKVDPHLYGEIKEKTKNWNDFVDEDEARFIEDRLSEIMHQLDYSRYTLVDTASINT